MQEPDKCAARASRRQAEVVIEPHHEGALFPDRCKRPTEQRTGFGQGG